MLDVNIWDIAIQFENDTKPTHYGYFWAQFFQPYGDNNNNTWFVQLLDKIVSKHIEVLSQDNLDFTDNINDYIDKFLFLTAQKKYNTPVNELMEQFEDMPEKLLQEINRSGKTEIELKTYNYLWPALSNISWNNERWLQYSTSDRDYTVGDELKQYSSQFQKIYVSLFKRIETLFSEVQKQLIAEIEKVKVKQNITKENIAQVQTYINTLKNQIMGAA